jgi:hypothetical protein
LDGPAFAVHRRPAKALLKQNIALYAYLGLSRLLKARPATITDPMAFLNKNAHHHFPDENHFYYHFRINILINCNHLAILTYNKLTIY